MLFTKQNIAFAFRRTWITSFALQRHELNSFVRVFIKFFTVSLCNFWKLSYIFNYECTWINKRIFDASKTNTNLIPYWSRNAKANKKLSIYFKRNPKFHQVTAKHGTVYMRLYVQIKQSISLICPPTPNEIIQQPTLCNWKESVRWLKSYYKDIFMAQYWNNALSLHDAISLVFDKIFSTKCPSSRATIEVEPSRIFTRVDASFCSHDKLMVKTLAYSTLLHELHDS